MKLPGVATPENEVDDNFLPPLLPSDYDIDNESDVEVEDIDTSTQQRQRIIHPEAMPSTASNVYNLRPQKQPDYAKENIY